MRAFNVHILRRSRPALVVPTRASDARTAVESAVSTLLTLFTLDELAITFTYVRSAEMPMRGAA